jgi:hypothetical protein
MTTPRDTRRAAEEGLRGICALLSVQPRDENFGLWLHALQALLPDCENCPRPMVPMRATAQALCNAAPGRARDAALARLRFEVAQYYAGAAAHWVDEWRAASGVSA